MVCSGKLKKDTLCNLSPVEDLFVVCVLYLFVVWSVRAEARGRTSILVALCPISVWQGLLFNLQLGWRTAILSPPPHRARITGTPGFVCELWRFELRSLCLLIYWAIPEPWGMFRVFHCKPRASANFSGNRRFYVNKSSPPSFFLK